MMHGHFHVAMQSTCWLNFWRKKRQTSQRLKVELKDWMIESLIGCLNVLPLFLLINKPLTFFILTIDVVGVTNVVSATVATTVSCCFCCSCCFYRSYLCTAVDLIQLKWVILLTCFQLLFAVIMSYCCRGYFLCCLLFSLLLSNISVSVFHLCYIEVTSASDVMLLLLVNSLLFLLFSCCLLF